ncbi:arginine--tRNA ligase [Opitutus sp. GAS368]|jgi:arginyl-tRNA synthetase|uniref:arginine--tRNA ligase n=1 Tax=Opitutus sp. GAS368 TaxID=1882749 RepID=UPI00087BA168|nr:arginine--tRNA ligase [Opitutus sp. GAS368]SDR67394.1 arginyl-tRNA synthetase [Opitutus sp. GAS368]
MSLPFNVASHLDTALRAAAAKLGLADRGFQPEVRVADPANGDYQANGALAFAKREKQNPRALAQQIVDQLGALQADYDISLAGPGFINFRLKPAALLAWLQTYDSEEHLQSGAASARHGQTWVVDYSSPNTAKQMHVGHLRSAVIGEAICRLLAFSGAKVIRDNHIGDWGTQFGKLIWAYKRHLDPAALARDPLEEFERLYKLGNTAAEADPAVLAEAQQELVKLQAGDAGNLAIWKNINDVSLAAFQEIYDRLGIKFDVMLGESFYNDQVERIYRELTETNLAQPSEGALVVFHPEHPRFAQQPFIIRKSDGAANYASSDLATALYRAEHFKVDGIIVVTDFRQADHFEQLYLTVRKWFAAKNYRVPELHHVTFGSVNGEDGKALKTRDGGIIRLKALLDEAQERSYQLVTGKNPDFPEAERRTIADLVGVASVQYADLSQNRSSDYVFAWDKMISLEGNTAAYLLYAVTRIRSIFRKAGLDAGKPTVAADGSAPVPVAAAATAPETLQETDLARKLVKFSDAVQLATNTLRPHFLGLYLYELAGAFSTFYAADKVIVDDPAVRARRLLLCHRTLVELEAGLHLLGLRTDLERM